MGREGGVADVKEDHGLVDQANDVMERIVSTIEGALATTRDKAAELVNRGLDSLFEERYDAALRSRAFDLLTADPGSDTEIARYVRGAVGSRLVGYVARILTGSRLARVFKLTPTRLGMTLALGRAQLGVQRVLHDVRVLASYLHARARREGVELERSALRAAVISVVADDRRKIDPSYHGPGGGLALVKSMVGEAVNPANAGDRRARAERMLDALDAVDLRSLADTVQRG